MKKLLFFLAIALTGCGAKTTDDKAKELITQHLKTSLPSFNNYESLNFGTMELAFLPYEETDTYVSNLKAIKALKDSADILQQLSQANTTGSADGANEQYKQRRQQLLDSATAKNDFIHAGKRVYVPEQLPKISHAYTVKDKSGDEKKTEEAYYFDKDFTKIIKVKKIY